MKLSIRLTRIAAVAATVGLSITAGAAQRTFVASYGNDANACSLTAPCRSFATAIAHANSDGEVIVLDSAGYGAVVITKPIAIIAPPGVYAGISVFSGDGVTVNGSIYVTLRGLTINGQGAGTYGVELLQDPVVLIDGCAIRNMGADGVRVQTGGGAVTIANTSVTKSAGSGVRLDDHAIATIVDSRVESNGGFGVWLLDSATATIARSAIAGNGLSGVNVYAGNPTTMLSLWASVVSDHPAGGGVSTQSTAAGKSAHIDVSDNTFARNDNGIEVGSLAGVTVTANASNNQISDSTFAAILASGAGSTVRASGNAMMRGQYGIFTQSGATIYSPGNNYVRDNSTLDDSAHTADTLL
jgi:hypothetical protein